MINFIPPIRASLFVSLIYLICFQFFLQSGSYVWLYLGNIVCFICSVLYIRSLNNSFHSTLNMLVLTAKGVRLSLLTAILSLAGAAVVFLLNFYLFAGAKPYHLVFKSVKESLAVAFANSFLVNLVAGSLAAFFTAGFVNERNYQSNSRVLASVKS